MKINIIKQIIFLSILLFVNISFLNAQGEFNNWYFGNNAGVTFNSGTPVALTNGALNTGEGCASISDAVGNILFYTDGMSIWNSNHVTMPNGTGLLGNSSSSQSAIIVQKPNNNNLYYVFTVGLSSSGMYYSIVDMTLNGGLGDVTAVKNVLLCSPVTEKVTAIKHCNNNDIWVITHLFDSNEFYAYLITNTGINTTPIITSVGTTHTGSSNAIGYMKASPDGSKIGLAIRYMDLVELLDFDNNTGVVSNSIVLSTSISHSYGIEFSPDGTKLYASNGLSGSSEIWQWDISSGIPSTIIASQYLVGTPSTGTMGALQLGPDDLIYFIGWGNNHLGSITSPDLSGVACGYIENAVSLGGQTGNGGLPTFVQKYMYLPADFSYTDTCFGDNTYLFVFDSTSANSFYWNFDDPASGAANISTSPFPHHIFSAIGTYDVMLVANYNCGADTLIQQVNITNCGSFTVTVNSDTICEGSCTDISATVAGGTSPFTYSWNPVNLSGAGPNNVCPTTTSTYSVTITDALGDTTSGSGIITVNPLPIVDAGANQTVCENDQVTLTAANPNSAILLWDNSVVDGVAFSPSVGTVTYTVTASLNGCVSTDSVEVIVNSLPTFTVSGTNPSTCGGNDGYITLSGLNSNTSYLITYNNGSTQGPTTMISDTIGNIVINNLGAGSYTDFIVELNGCSTTDNSIINLVDPNAPIIDAGSLQIICDGEQVTLTADNPDSAAISWDNGVVDGVAFSPSVGTVTYTVTANLAGCISSDQVDVTVHPLPIFTVSGTNPSTCGGNDGYITLSGLNPNTSYLITYNNGSTQGPTTMISDASGNITINNLGAGSYTDFVVELNSCSTTDNSIINLVEPNAPIIDAGSLQIICDGDQITLTANNPDNATISWDNGVVDGIAFSPSVGTVTYTVTANLAGCISSDQVDVIVNPTPTPAITGILSFCTGTSTSLDAGIGYSSYLWNTGITTQTLDASTAGTYSVTVSDTNGCSGNANISITEVPAPTPVITGNTFICYGSSTMLSTASGYATYTWSNGATSASINVSNSGNYSVTVTNALGCSGSTNINIQTTTPPTLTIFTNNDAICPGESTEIHGIATGGMVPYTIYDDNNNIINFPYIVSPTDTTTYIITLEDGCGGTISESININVYPKPIIAFTSDIISGCQPLTVTFNELHDYTSYLWNFGDNDFNNLSFEHNPSHIFQNSGIFDVSVTGTNEYGCKATSTFTDMITVYPKPNAKFSADPSVTSIIHPLVNFYNYSTLNDFNYWSFGDGDSSMIENPYHLYADTGNYIITLIVETQNGCKDTTQSKLTIIPEVTFYAPTAFSPDGDHLNDNFFVIGTGIDNENFHLYVYDRWGEIIFESDDITKVWNGATASGKIAENGAYSWLCYYYDIFGVAHQETGQILIIR